tara:strand:+ start:1717 stop:2079 length:363 start_codon:yes stop_codon:yes gene_type:complete
MIEFTLTNIEKIYETININKALFVVKFNLLDQLKEKLLEQEYPVCSLKESSKFINHNSRILLINSAELYDLRNNENLYDELYNINLVIFIDTPIIPNQEFYEDYFNMDPINNGMDHIFQL